MTDTDNIVKALEEKILKYEPEQKPGEIKVNDVSVRGRDTCGWSGEQNLNTAVRSAISQIEQRGIRVEDIEQVKVFTRKDVLPGMQTGVEWSGAGAGILYFTTEYKA